jgi:hypothetical protein
MNPNVQTAALNSPRRANGLAHRVALFVTFAFLCFSRLAFGAEDEFPEYKLKAAFLFNFAKFIHWPADAIGPNEPLVIGVLGENIFKGHLEAVIKGKLADGHPVIAQYLPNFTNETRCHILFIPKAQRDKILTILQSARGRPILTVSETDGFCQAGGMINLRVESDSVRFDLNIEEAQKANLSTSGRLSGVATLVKTDPRD